jgi:hypothetical protein
MLGGAMTLLEHFGDTLKYESDKSNMSTWSIPGGAAAHKP